MRFLFFSVLVVCALAFPWWIAAIGACYYAFRYTAYELIILGMMIDVQFGGMGGGFLGTTHAFTFMSTLIVVIAESVKPQLVFYR